MIAKAVKGKSFRGALDYDLSKEKGQLLDTNMAGKNPRQLAAEFGEIRKLKPNLGKAVLHVSLSAAPGETLTDAQWCDIGQHYLKGMGLDNNQYVMTRHTDTDHEHIHLVVNRIQFDGQVTSDSQDFKRQDALMRQIEKHFGLTELQAAFGLDGRKVAGHKAPTKGEIEESLRTARPSTRQQLQQLCDAAAKDCRSVTHYRDRLAAVGVEIVPSFQLAGEKLNGLTYKLDGVVMKGGDLGKAYSPLGLSKIGVTYDKNRDFESLSSSEKQRELQNAAGIIAVSAAVGETVAASNNAGGIRLERYGHLVDSREATGAADRAIEQSGRALEQSGERLDRANEQTIAADRIKKEAAAQQARAVAAQVRAQAEATAQAQCEAAARAVAQAQEIAHTNHINQLAELKLKEEKEDDTIRAAALAALAKSSRATGKNISAAGESWDGTVSALSASARDLNAGRGHATVNDAHLGRALEGAQRRVAERHYGRVVETARRQFKRADSLIRQAGQHIGAVVKAIAGAAQAVATLVGQARERQQAAQRLAEARQAQLQRDIAVQQVVVDAVPVKAVPASRVSPIVGLDAKHFTLVPASGRDLMRRIDAALKANDQRELQACRSSLGIVQREVVRALAAAEPEIINVLAIDHTLKQQQNDAARKMRGVPEPWPMVNAPTTTYCTWDERVKCAQADLDAHLKTERPSGFFKRAEGREWDAISDELSKNATDWVQRTAELRRERARLVEQRTGQESQMIAAKNDQNGPEHAQQLAMKNALSEVQTRIEQALKTPERSDIERKPKGGRGRAD